MARIQTVLVANRGEIAVRVIRACRETGRRAIAVYSDPDRNALHVRLADEAIRLGPAESSKSYLDVQKVIAAAKASGADAVHPGYGFLSERAEAARAIEEAGLIWIGPRSETIAQLGDKLSARLIAEEAGVPLVPGTTEPVSVEKVQAAALEVGFPLLLKATGGGGGKGIRLVERAEDLEANLARAQGESQSAFGTADVYLERFVSPARHIEIQILGDGQGDAIHLGERECSLQRRQQKVVEESPAPTLSPELRVKMGAAAVSLAKRVAYRGAGTVEFLVDEGGAFYFLEVNARLQVEHPVTEWCTGFDLVRAQLHVAEEGTLPFAQEDWQPRGHAIELRVNAEDPFLGFTPSVGRISGLSVPQGPFVRVDTALQEGEEITPHYDSLLGKLTVWGRTREEALERWAAAASAFSLGGVASTLPLVERLVADPEFRSGAFHTRWLEPWVKAQAKEQSTLSEEERPIAALAAVLAGHFSASRGGAVGSSTPREGLSPWVAAGRRERLG
ncbi:MAG: ATP-grasp domain-containing protein [Planctomycetes bacterium]|nr:ATP-grasp domain-containing protein [Planctomycetota bacterium]